MLPSEAGATPAADRNPQGSTAVSEDDRDRFCCDYKPKPQRLEPVILAPPQWTLTKGTHSATAHVKSIDGVGLELRFSIDGELRHSQIFRDWPALEKRADFEARGWRAL